MSASGVSGPAGQSLSRTASTSSLLPVSAPSGPARPAKGSVSAKPSPTCMVTLKNAVVTLAKICAVIIGAPVFVVGGLASLAGSTSSFAKETSNFVTSIFKPTGKQETAALTAPLTAPIQTGAAAVTSNPNTTTGSIGPTGAQAIAELKAPIQTGAAAGTSNPNKPTGSIESTGKQEISALTPTIQAAKPTGKQEIAELTATIQTIAADDISKPENMGQCSIDFFRNIHKVEVTLPGGGSIAAPIAGGEKAFLIELLSKDPKITDETKAQLELIPDPLKQDSLTEFANNLPEGSMTYSIFKMMNQSMLGPLNDHMATAFFKPEDDTMPATRDRRIHLDISDLSKPKVTSSQIVDYINTSLSETPVLSVATSLSVQQNLGTGQVSSSVEFNSIHTPTPNPDPSLKAAQAHVKDLEYVGLVERLKGMSIESQLITLNSEFAKPAQKEAAQAAVTELVQYHIEQGTGQQFTSAAIIGQMKTEMEVPNREKGTLLRSNGIGSLAFATFANAVGKECLGPLKEKMDAIGNAAPMEIKPHLVLKDGPVEGQKVPDETKLEANKKALTTATQEVFDIVANLDSSMPDSLKAVLRDVIQAAGAEGKGAIQAAGAEGKGAFVGTFFLRVLNPVIATNSKDNSPNKQAKTEMSAVIQKVSNSYSTNTEVKFPQPERKYLEPLANSMIGTIDALYTRLKGWTPPPD